MAALYKTLCLCLSLFFLLFSATDATASPGYTAGISLSPGNTIALIAPASPSPESIAPTTKVTLQRRKSYNIMPTSQKNRQLAAYRSGMI